VVGQQLLDGLGSDCPVWLHRRMVARKEVDLVLSDGLAARARLGCVEISLAWMGIEWEPVVDECLCRGFCSAINSFQGTARDYPFYVVDHRRCPRIFLLEIYS
jgi:hypothetical protein